jgi:ribonuclease J
VLTHGHEDHIGGGALPAAAAPDIPLVGSRLTLALIEAKLKEHRITPVTLVEVAEGQRQRFGPFDCEFVRSTTPSRRARGGDPHAAGLVLHTGDFKMDQLPLDGGSPTCALRPAR